jgi:hypothetical protein
MARKATNDCWGLLLGGEKKKECWALLAQMEKKRGGVWHLFRSADKLYRLRREVIIVGVGGGRRTWVGVCCSGGKSAWRLIFQDGLGC